MAIATNKKFWTEFIDIYQSLPCLWNTKDEHYNNRERRLLAWNKLVVKLQEVEPDANQESVKRKINTFRSNFNREVRKIRQSKKEQLSESYNPTLWYFKHLSFLLNEEKNVNDVSIDSQYDEEMTLMMPTAKNELIENETLHSDSLNPEVMADNEQTSHYEKTSMNNTMLRLNAKRRCREKLSDLQKDPLIEYAPSAAEFQTETAPSVQRYVTEQQSLDSHDNREEPAELRTTNANILRLNRRTQSRMKSQDSYSRYQFRNDKISSRLTDEATIYGQAWACGFRKLSPQQKLFAKKAIDDILILGQLKALKLNTIQISESLLEESTDQG